MTVLRIRHVSHPWLRSVRAKDQRPPIKRSENPHATPPFHLRRAALCLSLCLSLYFSRARVLGERSRRVIWLETGERVVYFLLLSSSARVHLWTFLQLLQEGQGVGFLGFPEEESMEAESWNRPAGSSRRHQNALQSRFGEQFCASSCCGFRLFLGLGWCRPSCNRGNRIVASYSRFDSTGSDAFMGFEDVEIGEDDSRTEFPCPYCSEDFDMAGLCHHITEEHTVEAKNGVFLPVPYFVCEQFETIIYL